MVSQHIEQQILGRVHNNPDVPAIQALHNLLINIIRHRRWNTSSQHQRIIRPQPVKLVITNYPEGSLCAANQLFDYVQNGTIQCGGDWGGYWSGKDTAFELLSTTMDNFTGMDYYIWITQAAA